VIVGNFVFGPALRTSKVGHRVFSPGIDPQTDKNHPLRPRTASLASAGPVAGTSGNFGLEGADVQLLAQLAVHLGEDLLIVFEVGAGVFAALADALAGVAVPCAGFLDDIVWLRPGRGRRPRG